MGLEKGKGVEVIDSLSVATLMKMVPEVRNFQLFVVRFNFTIIYIIIV